MSYEVIEDATAPASPASIPVPSGSRLGRAVYRFLIGCLSRRNVAWQLPQTPAEADWKWQLRRDSFRVEVRRII
jgi:hypothetical protein